VAVDLPGENVSVDASGYAQLVAAAAAKLGPQPLTIVGHSLAGITIPLVAGLTPVSRLVYLAALIPRPGEAIVDVIAQEAALGAVNGIARDGHDRSYWRSAAAAIEVLYHDCEPATARAAAARLRPQARTPQSQRCPLERLPDVPTSYILMRDDRMIRPQWSRQAASQRLGVVPIELPGGHSPMLANARQLADTLIDLAS
jgi:pimeloyl-ACP methyl ester carboxylesterase